MATSTAVLAVLLATAVSAPQAAAQPETIATRCAAAEAMITNGEVAEARDAYVQLRLADPGATCVAAVGAKLAEMRKQAQALYASGKYYENAKPNPDLRTARARYLTALAKDPSYSEAASALLRLSHADAVGQPFAEALRLSRLGLHADALEALKSAVKTTDEEVPAELQYLSGGDFTWWRENVARRLDRWSRTAGEMLAIVAVLGVMASLAIAWLRPPRVEVADLNDDNLELKVGKSVTALLRERTQQFSTNLLPHFGFVSGPAQGITLSATIVSAVPGSLSWLTAIPALLSYVHPVRVLNVTGTLHPAGADGAGLTISLRQGNRVLDTWTMWQRDFHPNMPPSQPKDASAYHALADPAAIWLLFQLSEIR